MFLRSKLHLRTFAKCKSVFDGQTYRHDETSRSFESLQTRLQNPLPTFQNTPPLQKLRYSVMWRPEFTYIGKTFRKNLLPPIVRIETLAYYHKFQSDSHQSAKTLVVIAVWTLKLTEYDFCQQENTIRLTQRSVCSAHYAYELHYYWAPPLCST